MSRRLAQLVSPTLAVAALCLAAQAQQPAGFLETLDVRVVNLEVYVTDRQGSPVPGLTAKDFTLLEDGKRVKLSNFSFVAAGGAVAAPPPGGEAAGPPGRIVLFFDNFAIQPQGRRLVLEELRSHFAAAPPDGTRFAVASYEGYLRMDQTFTDDRQAILAAVEASGRPTPLGVMRNAERIAVEQQGLEVLRSVSSMVIDEDRREQAMRQLRSYNELVDAQAERQRQQTRAAVLAMSHLVNALAPFPGRKAILYVGEGLPLRPGEELYAAVDQLASRLRTRLVDYSQATSEQRDAALDLRSSSLDALDPGSRSMAGRGQGPSSGIQDLTALANAGRVSFYALKSDLGAGAPAAELGGESRDLLAPRPARESNLKAALAAMADETGGRLELGTGVGGLIGQARADLGGYYFLGFQPRREPDGAYHKLKVRLKERGLELRYRTGYVDKPPLARIADRTSAALLLAHDENPLGVELLFGPPADGPQEEIKVVPVIVSVPLGFLHGVPGLARKVPGSLFVAARDPEGRTAPVQQLPIELDRESEGGRQTTGFRMLMRQGPQRLAVGLVVPSAGASAFVSGDLEVGSP